MKQLLHQSLQASAHADAPSGKLPGLFSDMAADVLRQTKWRLDAANRADDSLDTLGWGRKYLPAHFARPSSRMHLWLSEELARLQSERGLKINLIGPRGSAKSTIATLCYVLRCAVEAREPYIWIVSDTKSQAATHLENVKTELIDNALLAAAYAGVTARGPRWQAAAIELANGTIIESYGTGQRIRGRRRREHRPTLIVCDDLQNDSHIASALQRENSRRWFHGTLMKAGTKRTNVVNLATALHRDALALELHAAAGWTSMKFAAIETWPTNLDLWQEWESLYTRLDDRQALENAHAYFQQHRREMEAGAVVLWPEEEDLYTLMRMRVEGGHVAFEREKQGSPVDPDLCEWPESYFEGDIWFDEWPAAESSGFGVQGSDQGSNLNPIVIKTVALDPSKGRDARRGDYSAYVMLGIDAAGLIYVEADLARRATPQMVVDGTAICRRFTPQIFGVEANQYQELLGEEFIAEFRRQGVNWLVPAAIHNQMSKQVRIRRIGPYLSQRRLRFKNNSASTRLLVEQLRDFPAGAHDDGPDALEMALRLAEEVLHGRRANDGLGSSLIRF